MKMKHDNLWRANPDTAEEMDEIERRRKRAMRTAITLLALAVAVNVAVNEFSCVGPSPSKRDAAPAVQHPVVDRLVLPGGGAAGFRRLESGRRRRRLLPGLRHVHGRPLGVFDRRV